jgi:modification methylase
VRVIIKPMTNDTPRDAFRSDGAIMLGDKVGSIHRIGAVAQGAEACNGWTFWHIETKKGLKLIDELRAEIRSEMAAV